MDICTRVNKNIYFTNKSKYCKINLSGEFLGITSTTKKKKTLKNLLIKARVVESSREFYTKLNIISIKRQNSAYI